MTIDDLRNIFRRWYARHSISTIKRASGFDRNTIRNYIRLFEAAGYSPEAVYPDEKQLIQTLQTILPLKKRKRSIRAQFEKHQAEIIELITRKDEPVKAKTAYEIIKAKYDIPGSYETFKLFIREQNLKLKTTEAPIRIELPPGREAQIDYGKVGKIHDPVEKRNRVVWAFCSRLSYSRLPYIEFVYTQNQESFVESNINMLEFFGGSTEFITLDNLKAGVIKPALYDPKLNRSYAEFAEHYKTFINPCTVASPEQKGKVERLVPSARELFRKLKAIHPTYTLQELNAAARVWCLDEYGRNKHGTTGIAPVSLFESDEKKALIQLPPQRFKIPRWKDVTVSADRFFVLEGKYYAMPHKYRGKRLKTRKTGTLLRIFDQNFNLIREYVVTNRRKNWLAGDFPEDKEAMMQGEYPRWLMGRASSFGPGTLKLIRSVLINHAYLNARRARGILSVLEKYRNHPLREEICARAYAQRIHTPKQIKLMLESAMNEQLHFDFIVPLSETGQSMIRDINEYFN
jgi:transposase